MAKKALKRAEASTIGTNFVGIVKTPELLNLKFSSLVIKHLIDVQEGHVL